MFVHRKMSNLVTLLIVAIVVKGQLLQQLPPEFSNSTNVVWIGPDQFTLPWQFSRTADGTIIKLPSNLLQLNFGVL